jgi:Uma2 family endonuclease
MRIRSADDVLDIPVPDGLQGYELVNGKLVEIMPPGELQGWIAGEMYYRLRNHVEARRLGGRLYVETGYVLALTHDPERLRGADVSYVSQKSLDQDGGKVGPGFIRRLVPDLAVEVESPQNPRKILKQRVSDYLAAGTRLIWVIHSVKESATVYRADGTTQALQSEDVLDGEDILPGLQIPLRELFVD